MDFCEFRVRLIYIVPGEPGLCRETLCQNKNCINHINPVNDISLTNESFYAGLLSSYSIFIFFTCFFFLCSVSCNQN